jgi:hypothetical protein
LIYFNNTLGKFYENGKEIDLPELKNGKCIHKVTQVNDKLYCNGYEWKDDKWKHTLKALFYNIF